MSEIVVTHIRGKASSTQIKKLRDALALQLKQLGDDEVGWSHERVYQLREAMADLHEALDTCFEKHVNGYKRGDRVRLGDESIVTIADFTPDNTAILYTRNNGLKGRADVSYIEKRAR
ncbi:MAG: hypothetical protein ACKVP3_23590 [Hyphomicrobiaceae bacterium]